MDEAQVRQIVKDELAHVMVPTEKVFKAQSLFKRIVGYWRIVWFHFQTVGFVNGLMHLGLMLKMGHRVSWSPTVRCDCSADKAEQIIAALEAFFASTQLTTTGIDIKRLASRVFVLTYCHEVFEDAPL